MNPAELESIMKENQNGILSYLNGHESKADPLSAEMKDKDGLCNHNDPKYSVIVDDFSNGNLKLGKGSVAPNSVHTELPHAESDLSKDNHFVECDLPALIVCYKDINSRVIKDICVDEGVQSENKFLNESMLDDRRPRISNGFKHTGITKEVANTSFLFQDGFRSSTGKDCNKETASDCEIKGEVTIDLLLPNGQDSSSAVPIHHDTDTSFDTGALGQKNSSESEEDQKSAIFDGLGNLVQSSEEKCSAVEKTTESVPKSIPLVKEVRQETSLQSLLEFSSKCVDDDIQQSDQISSYPPAVYQGSEVSQSEESNKSRSNEDDSTYKSEVEGGIITFNFSSAKLADGTRDEVPNIVTVKQLKSEGKPIHGDGIFDGPLLVPSQVRRGDGGDASFSVGGSPSDRVMYSGTIPFSGSISLRSDSSTTSTRSFAFPVLPNEWNSSPIRMAKADRRFQKHRGWKMGLLCCRF